MLLESVSGAMLAATCVAIGLLVARPANLLSVLPKPAQCPGDEFGASISFVGDWNADGVDEFAIGSPREFVCGRGHVGVVRVVDGRSLQLILRIEGPAETFVDGDHGGRFGTDLSLWDDLDGDGLYEFAVLARAGRTARLEDGRRGPWRGRSSVHIFSSGAHPALVRVHENLGWECAGDFGFTLEDRWSERAGPDLDGDESLEIFVPSGGNLGDTRVLSGAGRVPLFDLRAFPFDERDRGQIDNYEFGADHCGVADLTGDGVADILVGAGDYICIYSGADGAFVTQIHRWELSPSHGSRSQRGFGRVVVGVDEHPTERASQVLPAFLVAAPAPSDEDCRLDGEVYVFDRRMMLVKRLDRESLDRDPHRVLSAEMSLQQRL